MALFCLRFDVDWIDLVIQSINKIVLSILFVDIIFSALINRYLCNFLFLALIRTLKTGVSQARNFPL